MVIGTGVRKLRDVALLPWRTAYGVLRALPRQLRRVGGGSDSPSIPNYDVLTATDAAIAVQTLTTTTDVQAALRHERAGKNRKTVADAGERRLDELATAGH